jgi:hypothetical protein
MAQSNAQHCHEYCAPTTTELLSQVPYYKTMAQPTTKSLLLIDIVTNGPKHPHFVGTVLMYFAEKGGDQPNDGEATALSLKFDIEQAQERGEFEDDDLGTKKAEEMTKSLQRNVKLKVPTTLFHYTPTAVASPSSADDLRLTTPTLLRPTPRRHRDGSTPS